MIQIPLSAVYLVLALLGGVALVYLILLLNNARQFYGNLNNLMKENQEEIEYLLKDLPVATRNLKQASENIKDVTEVVTETAADFLDTRDSVKNNIEIVSDVLMIFKKVFFKDL